MDTDEIGHLSNNFFPQNIFRGAQNLIGCIVTWRRKKRALIMAWAYAALIAATSATSSIIKMSRHIIKDVHIAVPGNIWYLISNLFPHMKEAWVWSDIIQIHVFFFPCLHVDVTDLICTTKLELGHFANSHFQITSI